MPADPQTAEDDVPSGDEFSPEMLAEIVRITGDVAEAATKEKARRQVERYLRRQAEAGRVIRSE